MLPLKAHIMMSTLSRAPPDSTRGLKGYPFLSSSLGRHAIDRNNRETRRSEQTSLFLLRFPIPLQRPLLEDLTWSQLAKKCGVAGSQLQHGRTDCRVVLEVNSKNLLSSHHSGSTLILTLQSRRYLQL